MSVVSRRVISNPERTSVETWAKIMEIICSNDEEAKKEFSKVSNIVASLLAEEFMNEYPMIMKGSGAQLRVYCLYGEDAISGEDANEEQLSWQITSENWKVFLPCSEEQLKWYDSSLSALSKKFKVYDLNDGIEKEDYSKSSYKSEFNIDKEAFRNL